MPFIFPGMILAIIIILLIVMIPIIKIKQDEYARTGKYPKGHYLGLGIALGIALGLPLGIAMDNPGLGTALGLPLGLALGAAWERQHENELRPLTEREHKIKSRVMWLLLGLVVLGLVVFTIAAWPQGNNQSNMSNTEIQNQLEALRNEPKFVAEEGTIYIGATPEVQAELSTSLNQLIDTLLADPEKYSDQDQVLTEFEKFLSDKQLYDTEDKQRLAEYLEQIMDIYGIESSGGILNEYMYGF